MIERTILFVVVLISTTQGYSQCACCAGVGVGSSNGDYNNGILTLPKKMLVAETYGDYRSIQNGIQQHTHGADTTTGGEAILNSMFIQSLGLRYGISNRFTISTLIPYVLLHTEKGNDKGLGDLILIGTFNLYYKNNLNIVLQSGIELPIGIQKNSNFDNTTVIIGSGSYDPIFGISLSKKWDKFMLQGSGLYKQTTNGFQGNYYGSLSVQNLSLSYRIAGENEVCSIDTLITNSKVKLGVSAFGGYYGEWLDKLKEDGIIDENSGHYLGFVTFGTNLSYKRWAFPLTVSLPIINQMNGEQNNAGLRVRLGVIKSF